MKNGPEEVVRSLFQCNKVLAFIPFSQVEHREVALRPHPIGNGRKGRQWGGSPVGDA